MPKSKLRKNHKQKVNHRNNSINSSRKKLALNIVNQMELEYQKHKNENQT